MSSESLSMCTEGLGFESFEDVKEVKNEGVRSQEVTRTRNVVSSTMVLSGGPKRSRVTGAELPPPISSIGANGKPWVCLKSFRENGRFILKEVRIPTHEILHACREDGRFTLKFIRYNDHEIKDEVEDVGLVL